MCGKNHKTIDVSTYTPLGLYNNKNKGGGGGRGWGVWATWLGGGAHGNIVLGPRALNGEGFADKRNFSGFRINPVIHMDK